MDERTREALDGSIEKRFENKYIPEPNSGCWLWLGELTPRGNYGLFFHQGKKRRAHTVSYEINVGPVPCGLEIDHKCRVHCCVNPNHLEPVTHMENCRRGMVGAYQRAKTHCPQGHALSGDNVYIDPKKPGMRACKACRKNASRAFYLRRK